jgi:hypothetical protein
VRTTLIVFARLCFDELASFLGRRKPVQFSQSATDRKLKAPVLASEMRLIVSVYPIR